MITPQDLKEQEFEKAVFGGYDITSVDDFFEKTAEDYAALYKENAVLKSKLKVLVEKVEEYRSTEDSMRMALLTAQKMGNEIVEEANKKSESIIAEARERAERREQEVYERLKGEEKKLKDAEIATSQFSRKILEIYKKQVEYIKNISGLVVPLDLEKTMGKMPYSQNHAADKKGAAGNDGDALKQSVDSLVQRAMSKAAEAKADVDTEVVNKSPKTADNKDDIARSISESLGDTKRLSINPDNNWDDNDDEPTTKRPRFDFEDLQFGSNFGEDQ